MILGRRLGVGPLPTLVLIMSNARKQTLATGIFWFG